MPQLRKLAAEWVVENPVLSSTQLGQETDTLKVKRGNNVDPWNALAYDYTIVVDSSGRITSTPLMRLMGRTAIGNLGVVEVPPLPVPASPAVAAAYPGTALYPATNLYPSG